ncbi:hypothetical protein ACNF49_08575 [Actinomadura sp. ATCC 39365]
MAAPAGTSCCAPIAREPLGEADAVELATLLKAVADPVRLRLLSMIGSKRLGALFASAEPADRPCAEGAGPDRAC